MEQTSDIDVIATYFCDNFGLSLFVESTNYRKYYLYLIPVNGTEVLLNIDARSREYMDKMADLVRILKPMGWLYA